jgi:hypothetical protein
MPPKKRAAVVEAPSPLIQPEVPEEQAAKRNKTDFKSLKEVAESPVQVVVHLQTEEGEDLRANLYNWLCDDGPLDFSLSDLILKCNHPATLEVLAEPSPWLARAKWSRMVDFICVLRTVRDDLSKYRTQLQEYFYFAEDNEYYKLYNLPSSRDLTELKVGDVAYIVSKADNVDDKFRTDLCASYCRLSRCFNLGIRQLDTMSSELEKKLGSAKFFDAVLRLPATAPECDLAPKYCPTPAAGSPVV